MKNTLKQIMFENENEFSFDYEYDNVKDIFSAFRKLAFNVNKYGIDIKALLEKMSCDISNNLKNNIEDNFYILSFIIIFMIRKTALLLIVL